MYYSIDKSKIIKYKINQLIYNQNKSKSNKSNKSKFIFDLYQIYIKYYQIIIKD